MTMTIMTVIDDNDYHDNNNDNHDNDNHDNDNRWDDDWVRLSKA